MSDTEFDRFWKSQHVDRWGSNTGFESSISRSELLQRFGRLDNRATEKHNDQNRFEEAPKNSETSASRPRESIVFQSDQLANLLTHREEQTNVQGVGSPSPNEPRGKEEDWFRAGLRYSAVRWQYAVSIGGLIVNTASLLSQSVSETVIKAIDAPFVALFVINLMTHYRVGKKLMWR